MGGMARALWDGDAWGRSQGDEDEEQEEEKEDGNGRGRC